MRRATAPSKRRTLLAPAARRDQLLAAAVWVFARKGYRHAQISDIIARANVARGTFYLHFDSKERIFLAIVEDFHSGITRAFQAMDLAAVTAGTAEPRAVLKASFKSWLQFFAGHRDAALVVLREAGAIDPRFEEGFQSLRRVALMRFANRFRRFQQLGMARPSIDPDLVAHLQLGMFDQLLNGFVLRDQSVDLDQLADRLADFEWNGIRPEPVA